VRLKSICIFLFSLPMIKKEIIHYFLAVPDVVWIQGDWYLSHTIPLNSGTSISGATTS
jgi:hypothetical protein